LLSTNTRKHLPLPSEASPAAIVVTNEHSEPSLGSNAANVTDEHSELFSGANVTDEHSGLFSGANATDTDCASSAMINAIRKGSEGLLSVNATWGDLKPCPGVNATEDCAPSPAVNTTREALVSSAGANAIDEDLEPPPAAKLTGDDPSPSPASQLPTLEAQILYLRPTLPPKTRNTLLGRTLPTKTWNHLLGATLPTKTRDHLLGQKLPVKPLLNVFPLRTPSQARRVTSRAGRFF
jgi:hypothetical protein